jgi:hypothetical protein
VAARISNDKLFFYFKPRLMLLLWEMDVSSKNKVSFNSTALG